MAIKKGGLGPRDLSFLISASQNNQSTDPVTKESELQLLSIDAIQPGVYQPRKDMHPEALEELANSIRAQGVIQPIIVRKVDANQYEIIAGERRWRAAQLAELTTMPVIVKTLSDEAAMAMGLIENIQREDLNPIEEAMALDRLLTEFAMTHQQVAEAVGKSRVSVSNLLRLLGLEPVVKTLLQNGDLEMGHARALLALVGDEQINAARYTVGKGLSVRETEAYVKRLRLAEDTPEQTSTKPVDPDVVRLERRLSNKLGAGVKVLHRTNGKGKLVIKYNSLDELEAILANMIEET